MQALTDIQQAVYDYTRQAISKGRPFPSLREIASRFGFQHTTARFHLKALEKKGYIQQRSQRVSDYRLVGDEGNFDGGFALLARIPAGAPSQVFEESREPLNVTPEFFGGGEVIAIRVAGDSMSGDAIADGDIVMIRRQQEVARNDILALRIEGEITLKRLRIDGDQAQLLPSNPDHAVRKVDARQVEVIGKLVGLVRKL